MSHYMLISVKAAEKNRQVHLQSTSQRSIHSKNSSSTSHRIIDNSSFLSSSTSSSSSTNGTKQKAKKVFDVNKNCYVDAETLITPCDLALMRYEKKLDKINDFHYKVLNQKLNSQYLHDSIDSDSNFLISKNNLNMLRYIYFEDFETDMKTIDKEIKENSLKPKLGYLKKIQRIQSKSHRVVKGLPSLGIESAFSDECDEIDEIDEIAENDDGDTLRCSDSASATTVDDLYNEYFHGVSSKNGCERRGVRNLFETGQFWNCVYQDFKMESPDLFEYLPAINQLKGFYVEVLDYLLYNIRLLEAFLDAPEVAKYKKEHSEQIFFYMRDNNFEWFNIMSNVHKQIFRFQENLTEKQLIEVELNLIKQLLSTILRNIREAIIIPGGSPQFKEKCLKTFKLWDEFLDFTFVELIHKRENYENELSSINTNSPAQSQGLAESIHTTNINAIPRNLTWSVPNSRNTSIASTASTAADSIYSTKLSKTMTDISVPILEAEKMFYSNGKIKDISPDVPKQKSKGLKGLFRRR